MTITLALVVLRFTDIDWAATFYQHLGISFVRHAHGAGPEHYSAVLGDVVLELYPRSPKSQPTAGIRLGFQVTDVDNVVRLMELNGARVTTPPTDSEWGRRAVIVDLEGHSLELMAAQKSV